MDIFRSAFSLVIHRQGRVTQEDIDELIQRYGDKKGIHLDRDKYRQAVDHAAAMFDSQESCLYMCTESRCLENAFLNPAKQAVRELSDELQCPVKLTGCHWRCDSGPVLTLKAGKRVEHFGGCGSAEDWQAARRNIVTMLRSVDDC